MRKRIPLVGSPIARGPDVGNSITKDQRFENCFPEVYKNPITGEARLFLNKRPGFARTQVAGVGYDATTASMVWTGYTGAPAPVFAYVNGSNVTVYQLNTNNILGAAFTGPIAAQSFSETLLTSTPTLILTGQTSGSEWSAWYYQNGGSWLQVTDNDYPGRPTGGGGLGYEVVGTAVHLDGYMFVMTRNPARLYNSDLNSVTAWTSTSFIESQQYPDFGVGLERLGPYIFAFNDGSIEAFVNAGNATGSPLGRVSGGTIRIGTFYNGSSGSTIKRIGNAIYFIGRNLDNGRFGVYKLTGPGQIQKISNPTIDKRIADDVTNSVNFYLAGSMTLLGMEHMMIHRGVANSANAKIPMYCIDTNYWWYFNGADPYFYITTCCGWNGVSYFLMANNAGTEGRNVYSANSHSPVWQDDGANYSMLIQTGLIDHGTDKKKEFTEFTLIADTQTTSGNVAVSYSNDDYVTFSTARNISMTVQQKSLRGGLGWGRRRAWKITESVNRPFRAEAFEVEWEVAEE